MRNDNKVTTSLSLNIQGNEIELTDKLPLLGVSIDCNLNFSDHITNSITKKASQRIGVLMCLKNLIPTVLKLQLYKEAILPHLTYYHLTWHFCGESIWKRKYLLRIFANFTQMPLIKEKDFGMTTLWMHMDAIHLQKRIKTVWTNVAKAQVDFQESPSPDLIMAQNFSNRCL